MIERTYGCWGKILCVDLKDKTFRIEDASEQCKELVGCRGLAIHYAWKYLKPGTRAFDDDNILMYFTGPVTGTPVLAGNRAYFFGVGAQSFPEMYTRSSIGGRVGEASKKTGFDGVLFFHKSEEPVIVEISEDGAAFHDASEYWGDFCVDIQKKMKKRFGEDSEACVIGPAGENKVRLAGIFNDLDNTAAQAGFGAVMGDKKMKAIVFHGRKAVSVKDHATIMKLRDDCMRLKTIPKAPVDPLKAIGAHFPIEGHDFKENAKPIVPEQLLASDESTEVTQKGNTCVACGVPCHLASFSYARGSKGVWHKTLDTTHCMKCVAQHLYGWTARGPMELEWLEKDLHREYRWPMNFRSGAEIQWYVNNMGLNTWDLTALFVYLTELEAAGIDMDKLTGLNWDVDDPALLPRLTEMMCLREGFGDYMAEGSARIAEILAKKFGGIFLTCSDHAQHGMNVHSLGTSTWWNLKFPYWVASALMHATGTRDPNSDEGHKYYDFGGRRIPFLRHPELAKAYYYGKEHTIDPDPDLYGKIPDEEFFDLGYTDKEYAVKKQEIRGVIMGIGVFCDTLYPQTLAPGMPETLYHGDWEMESKLLTAVTGENYTEEYLENVALKIWNMERAYSMLDIGRSRDYDMYIVHCHDAREGDWTRGIKIDPFRFGKLLDRYYALEGWDADGMPTEETLHTYGLDEINERIAPYRAELAERRKNHPRYEDVPANIARRGSDEFETGRQYCWSIDCGRFALKNSASDTGTWAAGENAPLGTDVSAFTGISPERKRFAAFLAAACQAGIKNIDTVSEADLKPCEKEGLKPTYMLKCGGFRPAFKKEGSFDYADVDFCTYTEILPCQTQEEADTVAEERNASGFVCPVCGKRYKLYATTNFEIANENQIAKRIHYSSVHTG
ncbi:MAG: hypothetical protein E7240_06765 [Lachnospiraceae bacterium]|nr:hypothetical protein [Lachnospiraceae bacterium]